MTVRETVNAAKQRFGVGDLGALFDGATKVTVAKGKRVTEFDLRAADHDPEELASAVLGPTGNLRAPAIRTGTAWLIGFHEAAYGERFD